MPPEKQILLVENDGAICDLWEVQLSEWGYSFDVAPTGAEALERARTDRYRMLLTDLGLPGFTGRELIHTLRNEQPGLAVIVVTGNGSPEGEKELKKEGVYDFISKPINFAQARASLRNCFSELETHGEPSLLPAGNETMAELHACRERFLAITGHELRTPVGVLKNAVDILKNQIGEREQEILMDIISRSSDRLVEIVEQMHQVTHWYHDKKSVWPTEFSLEELVHLVVGEIRPVLENRRQTLLVNIDDQLSLFADRVKFKKVLRELVENAIKFTGDQGIITVSGTIDDAEQVQLTVSDTGIGIAEEHWSRIFDLFYEAAPPVNRGRPMGTQLGSRLGIGLAIVKEIVSAHSGHIQVSSEIGVGSRFTVTLPRRWPRPLDSSW